MSWQFRLPFTVRNLSLELRHSSAMDRTDTSTKTSKSRSKPRNKLLLRGSKILLNSSLRLLLGVLPNIPVRIKQLTIKHQVSTVQQLGSDIIADFLLQITFGKLFVRMQATGFLLDIPRVEMLINSSRLSSKLTVNLKLLPIKAVLQACKGNAYRCCAYVMVTYMEVHMKLHQLLPLPMCDKQTKNGYVIACYGLQMVWALCQRARVYWSYSTLHLALCYKSPSKLEHQQPYSCQGICRHRLDSIISALL